MAACLFTCISFLAAGPVVLDNGGIRVEVDPRVFSVRFVGAPGGVNFVEPLHIDPARYSDASWLDSGGLQTDLVPLQSQDAAIRRGPAEVAEQTPHSIVMLGPVSSTLNARLRKEVRLVDGEPRATFKVTILPTMQDFISCAIRNTVRVPKHTTLRIEKADGTMRVLTGAKGIAPSVVKSMRYWLIPVPPTAPTHNVVLGAFVPKVAHHNQSGTWIRRIIEMPPDKAAAPNEATFVCLLDDTAHAYGASLQGAWGTSTLTEEWTLKVRGN